MEEMLASSSSLQYGKRRAAAQGCYENSTDGDHFIGCSAACRKQDKRSEKKRPTLAILYSLITRWRKALLYFQIKKKFKDHLGRERVYFNMQRFACRAAAGAPHSLSLDVHIS
ncbi:hypothetical protein H0E87_013071 [Populus deltoides]|uniref:Uncharacterized protein n=1 Tax=Populus deltoides TaxID=3696 RepID=A0A8T2YLQ5_POPDE|nr:hypothetical protein H0E87_013071 [Populus deltoides]